MHARGEPMFGRAPIARVGSGRRRDVPPAQAVPGAKAAEAFVVSGVHGFTVRLPPRTWRVARAASYVNIKNPVPVISKRACGNESNARRLVGVAAEIEFVARMKPSDARSMTIAYPPDDFVSILRTNPFTSGFPTHSSW